MYYPYFPSWIALVVPMLYVLHTLQLNMQEKYFRRIPKSFYLLNSLSIWQSIQIHIHYLFFYLKFFLFHLFLLLCMNCFLTRLSIFKFAFEELPLLFGSDWFELSSGEKSLWQGFNLVDFFFRMLSELSFSVFVIDICLRVFGMLMTLVRLHIFISNQLSWWKHDWKWISLNLSNSYLIKDMKSENILQIRNILNHIAIWNDNVYLFLSAIFEDSTFVILPKEMNIYAFMHYFLPCT